MKEQTKTAIAHDLAAKINAYLQRFEASPKINPRQSYDAAKKKWVDDPMGSCSYFGARAVDIRHRVWVIYVTYQGGSYLSIDEAQTYLAWLDAGNVGRHYDALRGETA